MSKCVSEWEYEYLIIIFFIYVILQVFGLWLPPAKGRSGTPAVATESWYKKKSFHGELFYNYQLRYIFFVIFSWKKFCREKFE